MKNRLIFKRLTMFITICVTSLFLTQMALAQFGTDILVNDDNTAFNLGVVYNDKDGDNYYDAGEGLSNVAISVSAAGSTTTATAGGVEIPVSAAFSDGSKAEETVAITTENKKIDFLKSAAAFSGFIGKLTIGSSPGMQSLGVTASQPITMMLNLSNTANALPAKEWIWFTMIIDEQPSSFFALTSSGWQAFTGGVSLESLVYNTGGAVMQALGVFSLEDLGLKAGDVLTYGYAYSTGSVADLVVENMVTIQA